MKTLLLFANSLFATCYCLANGSEKVCVVTNSGSSGQVCSATELRAAHIKVKKWVSQSLTYVQMFTPFKSLMESGGNLIFF